MQKASKAELKSTLIRYISIHYPAIFLNLNPIIF